MVSRTRGARRPYNDNVRSIDYTDCRVSCPHVTLVVKWSLLQHFPHVFFRNRSHSEPALVLHCPGVTLRNLNSRLSEQLLHQDLMEEERSRTKRAGIMAEDDGDDKPTGRPAEAGKLTLANRQLLGKGCISGQKQRRSMSRAAEIALERFNRAGQLTIMASPLAYGLDQIEGLSRGSRPPGDAVDARARSRDLLSGRGALDGLASIR